MGLHDTNKQNQMSLVDYRGEACKQSLKNHFQRVRHQMLVEGYGCTVLRVQVVGHLPPVYKSLDPIPSVA